MESITKEFEHLKIHLEELKKATNNFGSKPIGVGGFGNVYEGEITHSQGRSKVAIKRLSRRENGQGDPEFWKEIMMFSRYTHSNLISLLGFCDDDGEKIIVYEHASNGSLDRHLSSTSITWTQRLKICLDVARGLTYLHDHKDTQQRVLHRDIKSANILLDDNWNAKLSDMGLSKLGPANQLHTVLFTKIAGTPGYCDPLYMETYALTKESDIYSFGVVLFEVLCGSLCFKCTNGRPLEILVPMWKQSYKSKKLDQIIFKDVMPPMDPSALETFSNIVFRCLHNSREQRPSISFLVKMLEIALLFQERHEMKLTKDVGTSRKSSYVDEVGVILSNGKGLFLNTSKKKREEVIQKHDEGSGAREAEGELILPFDGTMGFAKTDIDLFSGSAEIIGENTYGTYCRGTLKNGDRVVVNRLRGNFTKTETEVKVELNLLREIRHPNLLAMTSYRLHPDGDQLLVYDYTHKGISLAAFLHGRGPKQPLNWATRKQIAKGVVSGLHSLHTNHNIIHGNLTSHNIFLDKKLNPKISDFGLSHLITAAANSNMIATTLVLGYLAPELFMLENADKKADIYSLGVIMLELLTGKSPGEVDLPQWVRSIKLPAWTMEVFDGKLRKHTSFDKKEMLNILQIATDCVHKSPQDRPDVHQVLIRAYKVRS